MSYHGSPLDSIANHIERVKEREDIRLRGTLKYPYHKRIRDPAAYQKVAEENKRLDLPKPHPRHGLPAAIRLTTNRKPTLPSFSFMEKPEVKRVTVENHAIENIQKAIRLLQFSLAELGQTPNPDSKFKNRVEQIALVEAIRKLSFCVIPPLPIDETMKSPRVRMPLSQTCVGCGGPGRIEFQREWFCEHCAPEQPNRER